MSDTVELIGVNTLNAHPQNPRLTMREDVVESIVANLGDGFDPAHALIVRPVHNGFQVLSGHHRLEAARRVGITHVPCWVREMDDDAAYMALVTSNSQGELSPLERGIHHRGSAIGVREYARMTGRSHVSVLQESKAAGVVSQLTTPLEKLNGKVQHLSAIHALPASCWQEAVEAMLAKGWSAKETAERVKASEASTDKRTLALFTGKTTQRELTRIDEIAKRTADGFKDDKLREEWGEWVESADPIDVKEIQAKRIEFEDRDADASEEKGATLPQLVLADPPWRYDFAQSDNRQIENHYPSADLDEIISHRPDTDADCVLLLWATVAKLPEALEVLEGWGFQYKTHAVWDKEKIGMGYWFRGQHELLLVGTKGKASPPDEGNRVSSVFREPRGKHSAKPQAVYEWIEEAFHSLTKLEMYCRDLREGWQVEGNESGA